MKKINLEKIKFPTTPVKEITVNLAGEEQTFEIKPVFGKSLFKISLLSEEKNPEDLYAALCEVLSAGCEIPAEAAKALIDIDMAAAMQIVNEVMTLTNDFIAEKAREEADAKATLTGEKK